VLTKISDYLHSRILFLMCIGRFK